MSFHNEWKMFLTESSIPEPLTEEEIALLAEGRIDDAKKKYPQISRFVDYLARQDPSKNNKYLMWSAKQLNTHLEKTAKENPSKVETYKDDRRFKEEGLQGIFYSELLNYQIKLSEVIEEFHKNSQRLKNKDINSYKTLADVEQANNQLGFSQRHKRRGEKTKALQDTEIIMDNDYFYIARPYTVEAAAELGSARANTSWCIARGRCGEEWFTNYTDKENKAFYYIVSKFLSTKDDASIQCLTVGNEGYEESDIVAINNKSNDEISFDDFDDNMRKVLSAGVVSNPDEFWEQWNEMDTNEPPPEIVQTVMKGLIEDFGPDHEEDIEDITDVDEVYDVGERLFSSIINKVQENSRDHAADNPAGPSEDDYAEVEAEHEHTFEHVDVQLQNPHDYGGDSYSWEAQASWQLPDDLKWVDTGDGAPAASDYEDEITSIFTEAADEVGMWVDESEYSDYEETVTITMRPDDIDESAGRSGYKSFLDRMAQADLLYDQVLPLAIDKLGEAGHINSPTRTARLKLFEELPEFKNFNAKLEKGTIKIFSDKFELPLTGLLKALNYDKLIDSREPHQIAQAEPSITQVSYLSRYTNKVAHYVSSAFTNFGEKWIKDLANIFIKSTALASRQLELPLNESSKFEWDQDHNYPIPKLLAVDVDGSPQEKMTGTLLYEIPITEDPDRVERKLYFISWIDNHLDEAYKLLIARTMASAEMIGMDAFESETPLFRQDTSSTPGTWSTGAPQFEPGAMERDDSLARDELTENKQTNHKILFENWRKFLK